MRSRCEYLWSMAPLIPYKWLYQILVVATIAAALVGIWATYRLVRGKAKSYGRALGFLVVGLVLVGIQMIASHTLRGSTAPTNFRLYLTTWTLVVFALLRLPGIRDKVDLSGNSGSPGSPAALAGLALLASGLLTLTTSLWAGPSHVPQGYNWVDVLRVPLTLGGGALTLSGGALLLWVRLGRPVRRLAKAPGPAVRVSPMRDLAHGTGSVTSASS